ncbi:MAG: hypothetical protein EOO07_10280, partial [Chitinophagaceae bacterium]
MCYKKLLSATKHAVILTFASCAPLSAYSEVLTANGNGTHDGFYYSFWQDSGKTNFTLEAGGRYTAKWTSDTNSWYGGKGWQPGGPRVVNYSGIFQIGSSANAYLSLYGWTRTPYVEYYIVETWGSYNPSSCATGQLLGRYQSDGANYELRECSNRNEPRLDIDAAPLLRY